jgi:hypothetical protein
MLRTALVSISLVLASATPVLPASASTAGAAQSTVGSRDCKQTPARSTRRGILGALGGAAIGGLLGSNRVTSTISSFVPVGSILTDALLDLLDCDEQQKAAKATEDVTAKAEAGGAGTTVAWRSESRPGVSGKSTVTAVDAPGADGRRCMTVTDVVIVDGEETSLPKRMCRVPPSKRYAKV